MTSHWLDKIFPNSQKKIQSEIELLKMENEELRKILNNNILKKLDSITTNLNAKIDELDASSKQHIDQVFENYDVSTKQYIDQVVGEIDTSSKQHIDQVVGEIDTSSKQHINQVFENYNVSTKQYIDQVFVNYDVSIKQHIDQVVGEIDTSSKQHINQVVGELDASLKQHINQVVGDFEKNSSNFFSDYARCFKSIMEIQSEISNGTIRFLLGQYIIKNRNNDEINSLKDAELSIFSQWGEDGIIQWIINKLSIDNDFFIEFGVEDYKEANTRFLLMNNNWSGLIIDASQNAIEKIKNDSIYWQYDLYAICHFITKENINEIFELNGVPKEIGLLSIDIDGNDYWVWEAITYLSPKVIICEYNSLFGNKSAITIPYEPDFDRTKAHYSNLYWGASLPALCILAQKKGYVFIGSNSAGNNAFFIRKDLSSKFKEMSVKEGYVISKYRESRNSDGKLNFISGKDRIFQIEKLPVYDIIEDTTILISSLNFETS